MVIVGDVGPAPEDTEAVMNVLGPIQIASYGGKFFEIVNDGDTVTLSNSHHDLAPHTDEPFRYSPPGIIAFHAISPATEGGDSILIDGFRLAEEVRRRDPEAFQLLSSVPQAFERRFDGHFDLVCHARAIVLDGHGAVCGFRFAERSTSPPRLSHGEAAAFYLARRAVTDLIADPAYRIVLRLGAGDMLLFDNHRLMHGRTGVGGARHLRQCNVAREDAHSAFRMIARRLGETYADMELPMGAVA
jgi:gamma-butyrobetaine dioxygenase